MLSSLKPLLCRHEFYWSERHRSDLCRRCGKTRMATDDAQPDSPTDATADSTSLDAETSVLLTEPEAFGPMDSAFFDIPAADEQAPRPVVTEPVPVRRPPSAKVLKAQAQERRENLLSLLDSIAEGGQPSRRDSLDVVLAVIEDAHSADPVLFGSKAAGHFARLHEARSGLIF